MKFTKIKKRKIYETWQHKNRKTGIITTIHSNPNGSYHFIISCFIKRCGLKKCVKDNCNQYFYYNSLENGFCYNSFDECAEAVNQWYKSWGKFKIT